MTYQQLADELKARNLLDDQKAAHIDISEHLFFTACTSPRLAGKVYAHIVSGSDEVVFPVDAPAAIYMALAFRMADYGNWRVSESAMTDDFVHPDCECTRNAKSEVVAVSYLPEVEYVAIKAFGVTNVWEHNNNG